MTPYAVVQPLIIVLVLLIAFGYAFRSVAPRTAARLLAVLGRRLMRSGRWRGLQRLGARWVEAANTATPGCDACPACSGCAPAKAQIHAQVARNAPAGQPSAGGRTPLPLHVERPGGRAARGE